VSAVLTDDLARGQLPEAGVVVAADRDEVGRIGGERTVPDPALVVGERGLEIQSTGVRVHWRAIRDGEVRGRLITRRGGTGICAKRVETVRIGILGAFLLTGGRVGIALSLCAASCGSCTAVGISFRLGLGVRGRLGRIFFGLGVVRVQVPDFGGMVGRAGREVFDVRRKKKTRQVILVCLEHGDRDDARNLGVLDHAPDVDVSLFQREKSASKFFLFHGSRVNGDRVPSCCPHRAEIHRWRH